MLRTVVASAAVASAAAFAAPAALPTRTQAATRSSGITMQAEGLSRRAAFGAILAGAAAIPAVANAEVIPAFAGNTAKDPNLQLKLGGVGMTSVQGTGQTGIRTSAFKKGVLGNEKSATKFPRPGMNEEQIGDIERLTKNVMSNSAIDKSGIQTFSGKP